MTDLTQASDEDLRQEVLRRYREKGIYEPREPPDGLKCKRLKAPEGTTISFIWYPGDPYSQDGWEVAINIPGSMYEHRGFIGKSTELTKSIEEANRDD